MLAADDPRMSYSHFGQRKKPLWRLVMLSGIRGPLTRWDTVSRDAGLHHSAALPARILTRGSFMQVRQSHNLETADGHTSGT